MSYHKVMCELNPRSHAAEAFRILRTNLQFTTTGGSLKSLLITSSGPSEGKSTITANLATVMAHAGASVILLDCDLRWPVQHRLFGLANDTGLTDVLTGSMEIGRVLRDTGMPNIKVVTCGGLPPNPSELLGSKKTREVLTQLHKMADIVLLDSPPILTVADPAILSSMVDGCLLVIKSSNTKIDAVKQAKEVLEKAKANIIGTVLNAVEASNGYHVYESHYYKKNSRKEVAVG